MGIPELAAAIRSELLARPAGAVDGPALTAYSDAMATAILTDGSGPAAIRIPLLASVVHIDLDSPLVVGRAVFDPALFPVSSGKTRRVFFRAVVQSAAVGKAARVKLYDYYGITSGGLNPTDVTGSAMSTASMDPIELVADLTPALGTVPTAGVLELQAYADQGGQAVVSAAYLHVYWE